MSSIVSTLSLDLERFITDSTTLAKSISTGRDQTRAILSSLDRLRSVLSSLLTPGLNNDIDTICREKLGIHLSPVSLGFSRYDNPGSKLTVTNLKFRKLRFYFGI